MGVYFFIFVISIFFAFLSTKTKGKYSDVFRFLSFMILFFFSALRYDISFDYSYTYVPNYYKIISGNQTYFEPAFVLLNKIVYVLFNNVDFLFIICSFITLYLVYNSVKNLSSNFFISTIMLFATRFYLYSFGQIRQYIAIAIFVYSIKYIIKKDFKKYFVLIFIAFLFHKTAIIYFPIYFINKIKLSRKLYMLFIALSPIFSPILNFIYIIIGTKYYQNYIDANYGIGNWSIVLTATALLFTLIAIIFYNKLINNEKNRILLNLQLLLTILIFTISGINESYRIIGMFMYPSILLIPSCYDICSQKLKINMCVFLIVISMYSSYLMLTYEGGTMVPYKNIITSKR